VPQKRRAYDSKELARDIDDSIPADKKPHDVDAFFQVQEKSPTSSKRPVLTAKGP
jgi:hypothetical protein